MIMMFMIIIMIMMLEMMMMDRVEIRIGRGLVIRAAGRFAVLLIALGFLATVLIVSDRLDLSAPIEVVWNGAPV